MSGELRFNKKFLVLLNGKAGTGKDTFVKFFDEYASKKYGVLTINKHRSDVAKIALGILGWNGEKTEDVRNLLAELTDFGESTGIVKNYLTSLLLEIHEEPTVLFFHVRDPKSIQNIKTGVETVPNICDAVSLLLVRDSDNLESDRWDILNGFYDSVLEVTDLETSKRAAEHLADNISRSMGWVVKEGDVDHE